MSHRFRQAGSFRQFRHGSEKGPDLLEAIADPIPPSQRAAIARYLRECVTVAATSQKGDDALDPSKTDVSPIDVHTDGRWVWSEDLAYYVETYGAQVPADLAERALRWTRPTLDSQQMSDVIEWIRSGAAAQADG